MCISALIDSMTVAESARFGRFLNEMLAQVERDCFLHIYGLCDSVYQ